MSVFDHEIQTAIDQYCQGVNTLERDTVRQLWARQHDVSFLHPRGHSRGFDHVWAGFYQETMGRFSTRQLKVRSLSPHRIGDAAWVEFYWVFDAVFASDGTPHHTEGRETQVLVQEDGMWKLVHVRYSSMPVSGDREGF
jgi:ketosteroid isomerase-like protein